MWVQLKKAQLDYFRRKARKSPNEIYAVLLGKVTDGGHLRVHEFAYQKINSATPTSVDPDEADEARIIADAKKRRGLIKLGTIHSHPNCAPVMSRQDYHGHIKDGDQISGIVEVTNNRTRFEFWTAYSALPCNWEYF